MDDKYRFEDEDRAAWDTVELHGLPWSPEEIAEIERETAELEAAQVDHAVLEARLALLYEVMDRLEGEVELSRERTLQAHAEEYTAKLRCGS